MTPNKRTCSPVEASISFSRKKKTKKTQQIKVCLHVTSAFACAFDANYGIHGTKWRCLHLQLRLRVRVCVTQRMGWEPIFNVCVCVRLQYCNGYQVDSAVISMYFTIFVTKMSSALVENEW